MTSKTQQSFKLILIISESVLSRARECVFWPGMSSNIKQLTDSCEACQCFNKAQQKEPLMQIDAKYPWEKLGVDLFTIDNKDYPVTIDCCQ